MESIITSPSNNLVKLIKSLKIKKNRMKSELFIIEGVRFVSFALENNIPLVEICYSKDLLKTSGGEELLNLAEGNFKVTEIEKKIFDEITDTQNTQGVIGLVKLEQKEFDLESSKGKFMLILDRIQDPGNLGTIIRTADAAGVDMVVMTKGTVDPYNEKVLRSTMGSIFTVPLYHIEDTAQFLNEIKADGFKIISSYLQTEDRYDEISYDGSIAVVIGNEANGVSDEIIALSDEYAKIPIYGSAESLNASIAAAVIMYQAANMRNQK